MRPIDLTGQNFGLWYVLGPAGRDAHGRMLWRCRCSCGVERTVASTNLRRGASTSCGHAKNTKRRADITGQRFGRLTALERVGSRNNQSLWRCQCSCGNIVVVALSNLKTGHTTSCGCALQEAQQTPDVRVAAKANSPLTGCFETNVAARSFRLHFGPRIYDVHNLRNFVRTHPELFDINGDDASVNAVSKALYDAANRGYAWHGWTAKRIYDEK